MRVFKWLKRYLDRNVLYSLLIRLFLESYFEILLSSLLNIKDLTFSDSGSIVSSLSSFLLLISSILIIPSLIYAYKKHKAIVSSETTKIKYGSFYDGLRLKSDSAMVFVIVFMVRRLILSFSFVILDSVPTIQWQLCMWLSMF